MTVAGRCGARLPHPGMSLSCAGAAACRILERFTKRMAGFRPFFLCARPPAAYAKASLPQL